MTSTAPLVSSGIQPPRPNTTARRWSRVYLPALLIAAVTGCSGSYEQQLNTWVDRQEAIRKFEGIAKLNARFFGYSKLPGTDVTVRIPLLVKDRIYDAGSPIAEDRKQPPMLKLPGLRLTGEAVDASNGNSVFLYLAALPIGEMQGTDVEALILEAINGEEGQEKFEDVEIEDSSVRKMHLWRFVKYSGVQKFWKNDTAVQADGVFNLYLLKGQQYYVFVGWRFLPESENPLGLETLIPLGLSTIYEGEPPPLPRAPMATRPRTKSPPKRPPPTRLPKNPWILPRIQMRQLQITRTPQQRIPQPLIRQVLTTSRHPPRRSRFLHGYFPPQSLSSVLLVRRRGWSAFDVGQHRPRPNVLRQF